MSARDIQFYLVKGDDGIQYLHPMRDYVVSGTEFQCMLEGQGLKVVVERLVSIEEFRELSGKIKFLMAQRARGAVIPTQEFKNTVLEHKNVNSIDDAVKE